jgi:hypothetical protein
LVIARIVGAPTVTPAPILVIRIAHKSRRGV